MKAKLFVWFLFIAMFSWGVATGIAGTIWYMNAATPALLTTFIGFTTFPILLFVLFAFITE
ncbi:MAG: hypothetical protein U1C58_06170 [Flavobacteriaceae bacterium]|nr:hypothetical protein [Flavobacteriaceae bacterium]MDZ4147850.1 hypothetical protein [Flavobacteriaceae bacterium]